MGESWSSYEALVSHDFVNDRKEGHVGSTVVLVSYPKNEANKAEEFSFVMETKYSQEISGPTEYSDRKNIIYLDIPANQRPHILLRETIIENETRPIFDKQSENETQFANLVGFSKSGRRHERIYSPDNTQGTFRNSAEYWDEDIQGNLQSLERFEFQMSLFLVEFEFLQVEMILKYPDYKNMRISCEETSEFGEVRNLDVNARTIFDPKSRVFYQDGDDKDSFTRRHDSSRVAKSNFALSLFSHSDLRTQELKGTVNANKIQTLSRNGVALNSVSEEEESKVKAEIRQTEQEVQNTCKNFVKWYDLLPIHSFGGKKPIIFAPS